MFKIGNLLKSILSVRKLMDMISITYRSRSRKSDYKAYDEGRISILTQFQFSGNAPRKESIC